MPEKKMRVGVIGAGAISDIYLKNMTGRFSDKLEVVCVAANHIESAQKKAAQYGLRACTTEELCAAPDVDLAVILTPVGTHAGLIRQALEAGKHVYTEKTLTDNLKEAAELVGAELPLRYDARSRTGVVGELPAPTGKGTVVVATGGTSDIPVAEEAALTAEALGNRVTRLYDVGVAGLHRLLSEKETIMTAGVIIAVAGMEGALASVIGGLADCPVIAVPTSVGYGASFGGLSALLSMLNSCSSGVSVVNIDNGFGAGFLADRINRMPGPKD